MINLSKLHNIVRKDGKVEAQCPACHASGADATGNHLVVYTNGKFGCVAHPNDKAHNKEIFSLGGEIGAPVSPRLTIRRQVIPESKVLMKIGRIGREKPSPAPTREMPKAHVQDVGGSAEVRPSCPEYEEVENFSPPPVGGWQELESVSNEEVCDFFHGTEQEVAS